MKTIKFMKWTTAAVVLMVMSVSVAFAQQQGQRRGNMDPKEMAQRTVDRLAERLKLNQDQKDKIYKIQLAQSEEMQKAFSAGGGNQDREGMRARMTEMREKTDKQITDLLNDEQKAEYKKMQEERGNRGGNMQRGGERGGDGAARRGGRGQ